MKKDLKYVIGVDEVGEKAWVKNAGSILQDFLRFLLEIQEMDSFSRKAFARGCVVVLSLRKNTHNLNSSC
jgi:hypothetical protein